jgi:ubiquinone/menaquinone biosynthesis C-methylase UbiE
VSFDSLGAQDYSESRRGEKQGMVYSYRGHKTVDNYWDRYHLVPFLDVYDRFALSSVSAVDDIQANCGFSGKRVLDIGGGTGKSAFRIAKYANSVVSIEPLTTFLSFAIRKQKQMGITNVQFIKGIGEDLSQFEDGEFDCAVSVHSFPIIQENTERGRKSCDALVEGCLRVVKPGGYIALVSKTPGWLKDHEVGGINSFPDPNTKGPNEELLEPLGFTCRDVRVIIDYGTVEEALATWGFIYGKEAIDYIIDHQVSKLSWSMRIFHRKV